MFRREAIVMAIYVAMPFVLALLFLSFPWFFGHFR